MHRMLLVVGVLLLPGLARADSPKIEVDFRVGYGGSVDRQRADDLNIRSALDGGFGEIELRWMPKRLRTAARRAGRVGLRIQLGAGAGLTRSREITWCDDGFIGVTRESQLLGRGRGVRLGIGIGPVFRVQPRVAFGPLVHFNVHHVEGGAWEIDDRDDAARSDSP